MKGHISCRCSCRNPKTGKSYGTACPKHKQHGSWTVTQELANREDGSRRRFRRSGYATKADAEEARDSLQALLAIPERDDDQGQLAISDLLEECGQEKEPLPDYKETRRRFATGQSLHSTMTVGEWLDEWLQGRKRLRPSTRKRYEGDIRVHPKPNLGKLRLDRLRVSHLTEMFDAINEKNIEVQEANTQRRAALEELKTIPWQGAEHRAKRADLNAAIDAMPPFRRITGLNTQAHIKRTLRAALNVAIAHQVMPNFNPAQHVELLPGTKPRALIWTDERVAHWQVTGEKPSPIMVWTPEQTGAFLDHIEGDRLKVFWRLIAFRGLRRGEACVPRWMDFDRKERSLSVATQLIQDGWEVVEGTPKTKSGIRVIALDDETVELIEQHRERQEEEEREWGDGWHATGRMFTADDGSLLHPGKVSEVFARLVSEAGLPPVRLHDLRHGAATLMLAAGVDIKVVSETLGHGDTHITRDIYQAVLDDLARSAAEAVVKLVPRTHDRRKKNRSTPRAPRSRPSSRRRGDTRRATKTTSPAQHDH